MLSVAAQEPGRVPVALGRRLVEPRTPLPIHPALSEILPDGLRRGETVAVSGSVSLLLALLGTASAEGAWCALVDLPTINAEAAVEYGVALSRAAIVTCTSAGWTTAVGALLDAFDIVVARSPARLSSGDIQRLAARARTREAVLMPYLSGTASWPGVAVHVRAQDGRWYGPDSGHGRLRHREVTVVAQGRGSAARPRSVELWLPQVGGGAAERLAPVVEMRSRVG